jgi:hypothetical protein
LIFIKKFLFRGKLEGRIVRLVKNHERRDGAGQILTGSRALRFREVTICATQTRARNHKEYGHSDLE